LEPVSICNRCKDVDINVCIGHASTILKLNDNIAKLHAQLKNFKDECDMIKFARDAYIVGRHPSIKDALGFHGGAKDTKSHKAPNFVKEKGMRLWLAALILHMIERTMCSYLVSGHHYQDIMQ
jgi:hypothetical protein